MSLEPATQRPLPDLSERMDFALHAAQAGAAVAFRYFNSQMDLDTKQKSDGSPVTIADRETERTIRSIIEERYPEDSILGEEFDSKKGTSEYEWVIDPIDGTISFIHGVPLFGTMLACMHNARPVVGAIVLPGLDEAVYAAIGSGCWHIRGDQPPKRAQVGSVTKLDESLLNTTSLSYFESKADRELYLQLDSLSRHTRGWSDCYGWVLLATGRVDVVFEPVLQIWDFAAAIPIVIEAGGVWADFSGTESLESGEMVAGNAELVHQMLRIFAHSRR